MSYKNRVGQIRGYRRSYNWKHRHLEFDMDNATLHQMLLDTAKQAEELKLKHPELEHTLEGAISDLRKTDTVVQSHLLGLPLYHIP
jgi:hypothetical protein